MAVSNKNALTDTSYRIPVPDTLYTAREGMAGVHGVLADWDSKYLGSGRYSEMIKFYYLPEEISEDVTAEWSQIKIIGRSAPLFAYG